MNRRRFLLGAGAAVVLAACSGDDSDDTTTSTSSTTTATPGAGADDDVLLRTAAALSLSAMAKNPAAAEAHRLHAELLDASVTTSHPRADTAWSTAADAELVIASTFQAWAPALSTPELRQRIMSAGTAAARLYAVAPSDPPSLPEAFQLIDPAVPDTWLLD